MSKGLWYAFLAIVSFSVMNVSVKSLDLPSQEIVFIRGLFTGMLVYVTLRLKRVHPWGNPSHKKMLFWRGLLGSISLSLYFYTLQILPLGVVSLVQYLTPLFTGAAAYFFLKEILGWRDCLCLACGIVGVIFIASHDHQDIRIQSYLAVGVCLLASILASIAYLFARRLSVLGEGADVIILYFSLITMFMSLPIVIREGVLPTNKYQWLILLSMCLGSHFGQVFLTRAFRYAQTSVVTSSFYISPILMTGWGVLFFEEKISLDFLIGATLILGSQLILRNKKQNPQNKEINEINEVISRHSKTFSLSTLFLPPQKAQDIRILYAFCRMTDELADNPESSLAKLEEWEKDFLQDNPNNSIPRSFRQVLDKYQIPLQYPQDLIRGCKRDFTQKHYENISDLSSYCYQVASTVGLMSMYIIGFDQKNSEKAHQKAVEAGIALQLTNILRDVGEDLARGRIYLPIEDLSKYNLSIEQTEDWEESVDFKYLIQGEIRRAREYYQSAWQGIKYLNWSGRIAVACALTMYEQILKHIELNNFDVIKRRAYVPFREKISLLPLILYRSICTR